MADDPNGGACMTELPLIVIEDLPCRWRGEEKAAGRYACSSPKLVVASCGVRAELCQQCYCRDHEPLPPKPEPPKPHTPVGPGTELKGILASLGINPGAECGCHARARDMDRWGVNGCRVRRTEIVGWLYEEAQKQKWPRLLEAARRAVATGLVFNARIFIDPFGWLVDEAIRRAEAKAPSPPSLPPLPEASRAAGDASPR